MPAGKFPEIPKSLCLQIRCADLCAASGQRLDEIGSEPVYRRDSTQCSVLGLFEIGWFLGLG
jgi:hypothetical protein